MQRQSAAGGEVTNWRRYLRESGFPQAEVLGRGVEGMTFRLGDARVAKVWFGRSEPEVRPLIAFYEELRGLSLPFATPEIAELRAVEGRAVTIERELPGAPLSGALDSGAVDLKVAQECALMVLEALAATRAGPAAEALPVFNEQVALWSANNLSWGAALAALLHRRLGRYPAFDASTFAGFFDMYGPAARRRDDELTNMIRVHFGYPRELLLLYRAFYALVGSNAYDATGRDAHFEWCVATLNRQEISDFLLA